MTRGTPPPSVPIPTEDGYYWIRRARTRFMPHTGTMHEPCNSYDTWDDPEITVELVWIHEGATDWVGSDEGNDIEDQWTRLIEVIAKLEEPS